MDNLEWHDAVRLVTALMAVIALYNYCTRTYKFWKATYRFPHDAWWFVIAFLLLLVEGEIEQIIVDGPLTFRTFFSFSLAAVALRTSFKK